MNSNTTLFISDLHLNRHEPKITQTFFYFLKNIAPNAKALYILGDFFESYIGDDQQDAFTHSVSEALLALSKTGMPIFLMHGNRDFLIGSDFAKRSGVTLIADPTLITVANQKIILLHGDDLCIEDKKHQRFRKITRNKFVQRLFLSLPLVCRKKIAIKLRQDSAKRNSQKSLYLMDVSEKAVKKTMEKYTASKMIHGHTHRPMITEKRIVLDAWHGHGNYLQVSESGEMKLVNMELCDR